MEDIGGQAEHAGGAAAPVPPAPNVVALANGHTVTLYPRITLPLGIAAMSVLRRTSYQAIAEGRSAGIASGNIETALIEGALAEVYLRLGISGWDFTDARGLPEPIDPESIARLLPYTDGGKEVAEAADALYSDDVFRPLVTRTPASSPPSPTDGSTSPSPSTGATTLTPSRRSSRHATGGKRSGARAR